ncbi:MAG: Calvin cycle protein CP12 [Snowella sp.]|nr:Calvin cycle protein CP12 [Snowella sp.]
MSNLQEKIEQELKHAREVCSADGSNAAECATAWDIVEELKAEAAHQRVSHPKQNSLEKYCADNPDAVECRLYED